MSPNARETLELRGIAVSKSASGFDVELPRSLKAERRGDIAVLFLARAEKRNAIDDPTVFGIEAFFAALPDAIKAVVLAGEGEHFCSGLDLGELTSRGIAQGIAHSRSWHRAFERTSSARRRWWRCYTARWSVAGSKSQPPAISAWRRLPPITRCPKAGAASSSAGAARCACPASSGPRA